ncbi:MAG: hypothetical protein Q8P67_11810 [archaeon]|nr:hypothetical protein [archaeon]
MEDGVVGASPESNSEYSSSNESDVVDCFSKFYKLLEKGNIKNRIFGVGKNKIKYKPKKQMKKKAQTPLRNHLVDHPASHSHCWPQVRIAWLPSWLPSWLPWLPSCDPPDLKKPSLWMTPLSKSFSKTHREKRVGLVGLIF